MLGGMKESNIHPDEGPFPSRNINDFFYRNQSGEIELVVIPGRHNVSCRLGPCKSPTFDASG